MKVTDGRSVLVGFFLFSLWVSGVGPGGAAWAHPPVASDFEVFAEGLVGPEGLAFTRDGRLVVGSTTGELSSLAPDGTLEVLATVPDRLAGITVLADGRVLAAALGSGRVWAITPEGETSVFAEGIGGPNFVVQTLRDGRIFASATNSGEIVDITDGTPEVVIDGLTFPNGLAVREEGGRAHLYVALTLDSAVVRYRMFDDGSFGDREPFAEGLFLTDGIAFDAAGNLLSVGGGRLMVRRRTGEVEDLSTDPLINWASNLAFGQGPGFASRDVYLANFGPMLGDGTNVVRFRYNHRGAPLASGGLSGGDCRRTTLSRRTPLRGGVIECDAPRRAGRLPVR